MILETLFATTLRDYLKTADAQAAGLPDPASLSYLASHERGNKSRPLITVAVERANQEHPEIAQLLCTFTLEINVAKTGATGSGFTAPDTAETWILALRNHLADTTKLAAFLDTLSLADRTGWKVLLHHLPPHYKPEIDPDSQSREYQQLLQLTLWVNPPM